MNNPIYLLVDVFQAILLPGFILSMFVGWIYSEWFLEELDYRRAVKNGEI